MIGPEIPPPAGMVADYSAIPQSQRRLRDRCRRLNGYQYPPTDDDQSLSFAARFERIAHRYPQRPAVIDGSTCTTYDDLNRAANRIAHSLIARSGSTPEAVVILVNGGLPLISSVLGVLKANKVFVIVDTSFPDDQIRFIVDDAVASLVITSAAHLSRIQRLVPQADVFDLATVDAQTSNPGVSEQPNPVSYLTYTSGSTGYPKAVMLSHVMDGDLFHLCPEDRVALLTSAGSQTAYGILETLLTGAALCLYSVQELGVSGLASWLRNERITIYGSAPTIFRSMVSTLAEQDTFPDIRGIRFGGETVTSRDLTSFRRHFSDECVLVNCLASTESKRITGYFLDKHTTLNTDTVPVGFPLSEAIHIHLVDDQGKQVERGDVGQIVVESPALSPGYWRKPDETAAAYRPVAGGSTVAFWSGDLGRVAANGALEHVGRIDSRIKVRGSRVDLSAVEQVLLDIDGVRQAVVVDHSMGDGTLRLAAYLVASLPAAVSLHMLRSRLATMLPSYMVPATITLIDSIPRLPGGKVDRNALPPPIYRPSLDTAYLPPRSHSEGVLCTIWRETLGIDRVGIHDDFLDLGGNSLLAATLITRVKDIFGTRLPVSTLIQASTVARMAYVIGVPRSAASHSVLVPIQAMGSRPPLFCIPGIGGHVLGFLPLARALGADQPVYGLEPPGRDGEQPPSTSLEDIASGFVREIRRVQPTGPYYLAAYSAGGRLGLETVRQIEAAGETVGLFAAFDCAGLHHSSPLVRVLPFDLWHRVSLLQRVMLRLPMVLKPKEILAYLAARRRHAVQLPTSSLFVPSMRYANGRHRPAAIRAPIAFFVPTGRRFRGVKRKIQGWRVWTRGSFALIRVPGDHVTTLHEPNVHILAARVRSAFDCLMAGNTRP